MNQTSNIMSRIIHNRHTLINVVAILFAAFMVSSCDSSKDIKVLVLHQYNKELTTYKEFDETIIRQFKENGYNPEIQNFYLGLNDQAKIENNNQLRIMTDSLNNIGWEADVILAEGNRTLNVWDNTENKQLPSWHNKCISVFGGIMFNQYKTNEDHPKRIIIHDNVDLYRIVDLISTLTDKNTIEIELDHYHDDVLLYAVAQNQLSDNPQTIIEDSTGRIQGANLQPIVFRDSILVKFYSAEWKASHSVNEENSESYLTIQNDIDTVFQKAWRYPILVVKKDIWGESIAVKSHFPQFTICRELFNDGRDAYLCGYFASYEVIATDMVNAATEAIEGKDIDTKKKVHEQQTYMNYNVMTQMGLYYDDCYKEFNIINVPFRVANPTLFQIIIYGSIIILILLILLTIYIIAHSRKNSLHNLTVSLTEEKEMNRLAIAGSGNYYISSIKDLDNIISHMEPNQEKCITNIRESLNTYGTHTHVFRIKASMDDAQDALWWDLHYVINYNSEEGYDIEGYLLNVNDDVNYQNEMLNIKKIADATKQNEGFLWTMAHEIRTPLNSIVGFCDVLSTMGDSLSNEEKETIAVGIEDNNKLLERIVDNMEHYSHVISKDITYNITDVVVDNLIQELYDENKQAFEAHHHTFIKIAGRPGIHIKADYNILKNCMFQLTDNAMKYNKENKSIAIGWQLNLETNRVELFVEDNGIGISKEDQSLIFDMFWKKDTYVPGVGIGLTLAKEHITTMGGELKVVSELGVGSRFCVEFDVENTDNFIKNL